MADTQLPKRVYKGIPDLWRMAAWWTMADEYASQSSKGKGKAKANAVDSAINYRVGGLTSMCFCL